MKLIKKFISLFVFLIFFLFAYSRAEGKTVWTDSISTVNSHSRFDSLVRNFSNETKFGKWLYKNIYRSTSSNDAKPIDNMQSKMKQDRVNKFKGKVIRRIYYKSLDPFGTEVEDTLILRRGLVEDIGNRISVNTRASNIQSLILFKDNRIKPKKKNRGGRPGVF